MSIQHATHTAIRHVGLHTVTLPSEVIKELNNPDAFAIWGYLQTMPADWRPKKEHIKKHFSIGEDRYGKAMRMLRDLGLIYDITQKNEQGKITAKTLVVVGIPRDLDGFMQKSKERKNHDQGKPRSRKTLIKGKPGSIHSDLDIDLSKGDAPPVVECHQHPEQEFIKPEDLKLTPELEGIAKLTGYAGDIPASFLAFQGQQLKTNQQPMTDMQWKGAWQTWVAREKGWQKADKRLTSKNKQQTNGYNPYDHVL